MKIFIYLYKRNKINKMRKRLIFLALVLLLLIIPNIVSSAEITANAIKPDTVYTNTNLKLMFNFSGVFNNILLESNRSWLWTIIIIIAILVIYFIQKKWNVLKISIDMESEAIIAITTKMEKAEKLIKERNIDSAQKTYRKILKIYDGLPVKERKWVYKEIQSLYSKIKTIGSQ